MDWVTLRGKVEACVKKYRYVLLVLLCGLFLMMIPDTAERHAVPKETIPAAEKNPNLQDALEEILSQIDGAGEVRILLTQSAGELTLYQMDEDRSTGPNSNEIHLETVILSESALVKQVNPPVYQGAVVVCHGGNDPSVRLAVVEAVANATGLTTDHITVLKMK